MLRILIFALVMLSTSLSGEEAAKVASGTGDLDAVALVRAVETQYQGDRSHGKMRMHIQTRSWNRTLELEMWSEGREKLLTRILAPVKERGTCTLKVDDDIWNYISRIDRMIKIPSSLMGDSWMGSHLTNDDLVKENKIDKLYQLAITAQKDNEVTITGMPFPEAAVVWGKIVYKIDTASLTPLLVEYYDEDNVKVRSMVFSEFKQIEQRWLPMIARIVPEDKPEEFTEMHYLEIDFSVELPRDLFSLKSLRNR
ncbi:MAG: outer membrane lipoprotein-sorting protein [Candidatus Riflebacteria bacterium HGW-Riflebacteria-2]|nr:MAG: outer membrane lipoprotein-sorting protein [Candidatus Riflebacteria bacterium HGW-Riflebacteria-2]